MGSQEALEYDLPRVTPPHSLKFGVHADASFFFPPAASSSASTTPAAVSELLRVAALMLTDVYVAKGQGNDDDAKNQGYDIAKKKDKGSCVDHRDDDKGRVNARKKGPRLIVLIVLLVIVSLSPIHWHSL
jgi:hypothetical protein